jgi:RNA polymerase sigma-32 factor
MTSLSTELSYVTKVASSSPALTCERELELARRFRDAGDRRAADLLVRAYLRLVITMAVKYRHYGISTSDLVAEGNCGLVTALRKFDPERGIRFGTYARHWVRAYMLGYIIRSMSLVGGKTGLVRPRHFFKLRRERARITSILGEGAAADEELAKRMDMSVEELRGLLERLELRSVSLDAGQDSRERAVDELVSSDNPEERYFRRFRQTVATSAVASALGDLSARERFIAERRLMATGTDELSLADIAKAWGLSRERIRQLEKRTKEKLERNPAIRRHFSLNEWCAD